MLNGWAKQYGVTSGMGMRTDPITGKSGDNHQGTDFGMPVGTKVTSLASGTVTQAGWNDSYGKHIRVKDAKGNTHIYAHLSGINVRKGDRIQLGQYLGKSGNTGNSSGPHLHYEVRRGSSYGNAHNPFHYHA